MRRLTIAAAVLMLLLGAGSANAALTANFGDNNTYWASWASPGNPYGINTWEHIGVPDMFGGSATGTAVIESNGVVAWLKSITVTYNSNVEPAYVNGTLRYGDLFLATQTGGLSLTQWNYVVRGDHSGTSGALGYNSATTLAVKSFSSGISETKGDNDGDYLLSNTSTQRSSATGWNGYIIRYDHPWALSDTGWAKGANAGDGTAGFTGWNDNLNPTSSTWTFDDEQVMLAVSGANIRSFKIGFGPQCANDVIYETVNPSGAPDNPVPEPASLIAWSLLVCFGAVAAGWRRFRKNA